MVTLCSEHRTPPQLILTASAHLLSAARAQGYMGTTWLEQVGYWAGQRLSESDLSSGERGQGSLGPWEAMETTGSSGKVATLRRSMRYKEHTPPPPLLQKFSAQEKAALLEKASVPRSVSTRPPPPPQGAALDMGYA